MTEKARYFAIVPIHGRNTFVEAETADKLKDGIDEALLRPEQTYPFHDFKAEITVIKGRKIKLPK